MRSSRSRLRNPLCSFSTSALPLVDGWELAEELKMWDIKVPIVVVSGATPDVAATAQQMGAVDFLRKPFDLRDLIDKVDRVVLSDGGQFPRW